MHFEIVGELTGVETFATARASEKWRDCGNDTVAAGGANARDLAK